MRPVEKGDAPQAYTNYRDARNDLTERIGWYCSYCEMPVKNMIEVEHVIPQNHQPNLETDWDNFLLSCKYCNTVKNSHNTSRNGYFWPDRDNTDLVFEYSESDVIVPHPDLDDSLEQMAQDTIDLMGLNRRPGGEVEPTEADTRFISRISAWLEAKKSLERWLIFPLSPDFMIEMAKQIAATAKGFGHYSIWCKVFENIPIVLEQIDLVFEGTFKQLDVSSQRVIRQNGQI